MSIWTKTRSRLAMVVLLLFAANGCWLSLAMTANSGATAAEIRRGPPREAFKSGGERAVEVLERMAASLDRIEKRLESIEKSIVNLKSDRNN